MMTGAAVLSHLLFGLSLAACSAGLTRLMIRIDITDVPNERSSHSTPTPRGGGVAVAASFLLGLITLYFVSDVARLPEAPFSAFIVIILGIAGFALSDDLKTLRARTKLIAQLIAASCFALFVARIERIALPGVGLIVLGPFSYVITIVWVIILINAYNFMDGINGIAGGAALIAAAALALTAITANSAFVYLACISLFGAVLGFFFFNFPHARIFLGDSGSQFLGFVFAGLAVIGSAAGPAKVSIFVVPMILFPFLYDVCATLLFRAAGGKNIFKAHREHHYQLLIRLGASHVMVSSLYFALIAAHGLAAFMLQAADPATRIYWIAAPLPSYLIATIVLYKRAGAAGLIRFWPASGGDAA
jgi:UDP-GlcNAc:undecaprenyl-phosphate GlcNAc-1-phosphate transferase